MQRTVLVAHSLFLEGLHTTKNTASAQPVQLSETCEWHNQHNCHTKEHGEIHFLKQAVFLSFTQKSLA
jgi:hypothetical protein